MREAPCVVRRVAQLEKLPGERGRVWKTFFDRLVGVDLDSPGNMIRGLSLSPEFLVGAHLESPDKEWFAVFRVVPYGADLLALDLHALHHDAYLASWLAPIAPRRALEIDDNAVKMVTVAVIEGARRALRVIAAQHGVTLPDDAEAYTPAPHEYHAEIASKFAKNLRGSVLFSEVRWSKGTPVEADDDDFFAGG